MLNAEDSHVAYRCACHMRTSGLWLQMIWQKDITESYLEDVITHTKRNGLQELKYLE